MSVNLEMSMRILERVQPFLHFFFLMIKKTAGREDFFLENNKWVQPFIKDLRVE